MKAMHAICRFRNGRPDHLRSINARDGLYALGWWKIAPEIIGSLEGGWLYLHESSSRKSYFVAKIEAVAREDSDGKYELVVRKQPSTGMHAWRGRRAGQNPSDNYRVVDADYLHERVGSDGTIQASVAVQRANPILVGEGMTVSSWFSRAGREVKALLRDHRSAFPSTVQLEQVGMLLRDQPRHVLAAYAVQFMKAVDQWGGRSPRAMHATRPDHYYSDPVTPDLFCDFNTALKNGISAAKWGQVGQAITSFSGRLPGLGPSYSSKYARFLYPDYLAILDKVLLEHIFRQQYLYVPEYPAKYMRLIEMLRSIAESEQIRVADVEAALFMAIRKVEDLRPIKEQPLDLRWASEIDPDV